MVEAPLKIHQHPFWLGDFRIHPGVNEIDGPAGKLSVEPKVMSVLIKLAERPRSVVTREEFLDSIWSSEYGGDESLTRAVSLLRKALGDARGSRSMIETVPRRGYRLLVRPATAGHQHPSGTSNPQNTFAVRPLIAAVLLLALAVIVFMQFGRDLAKPLDNSPPKVKPVVAVLPFDSHTQEEDDRYLAEGLADEILSSLARDESISVIAGNSTFQFRGKAKQDLSLIAQQLEASHIVDGSVRRSENGLRIAVHLVNTGTGLTEWSDVFERNEREIFAVPGTVATSVLEALGLGSREFAGEIKHTPDATAYKFYLQAQALLREATILGLQRSIFFFEEAVRLDPDMASAWAELALARLYVMLIQPGQDTAGFRNRDPAERLAAAREEAARALAIDPNSVEARLARVIIDYRSRVLPMDMAEQKFRSVLELAPDHPEVNMRNGMMLLELGRIEESFELFSRAVRLDPLSIQSGGFYIQTAQHTGHLQEADDFIESGRCPWYPSTYIRLVHALTSNDFNEARDWLNEVSSLSQFGPHGALGKGGTSSLSADPLYELMTRLVDFAENGMTGSGPGLATSLLQAADEGKILHYYAALLMGAAGMDEPVFDLVLDRLAVDDLFFRGALFRSSLAGLRHEPKVMRWFDASGHLDYWLKGGDWPDFCSDPDLPYDCRQAAESYRAGVKQEVDWAASKQ